MHLRKRANGHWQAMVKHRGKQYTVTRRTRREALAAGNTLEADLLGVSGDVWRSPTVVAICRERLRTGGYSPTLAAEYRRAVDRIPDDLARLAIEAVRVSDVEAAYAKLTADGVGVYGIRRVHELLRASFAEAARLGVLKTSPMVNVRPPKKPDRDVHPPTPDQVRRILAAAHGPAHVALLLASQTGLRRGEIVALRWDAVDLKNARLSIVRSLAYTPTAGVHERQTKTGRKGQRTVSLAADVAAVLRAWKVEQHEAALANMLDRPKWVITDVAGAHPWRPDRLTHEFDAARRRAGVTGVRLHDLRHYVATQLLAAGVPPSRVAAMLGHTSTTTTESVYRHWIPGEDADLADQIGRITRGG